ncbi:transcription termination/antitermination protein NusG [Bradyrhizobium sp. HKCCYLRH3059]|nr:MULTISPECIES: transcription termination/antitermination protein NusG [unclassified Bradyrhizobium]
MNMGYQIGDFAGYVDLAKLHAPEAAPVPQCWYILRTHPNCEAKVMKAFRLRNISAYLPVMTVMKEFQRIRRGFEWIERRNVVSPLILGAVLIPDFEERWECWRGIDGAIGLLRFGEWTPHLTPKLFQDIRNIEDIANTPKSKRQRAFEVGQLVRVLNGPFRGFSARVERIDSRGRLSVGVEIFRRITPLEIEESDIEAVEAECA